MNFNYDDRDPLSILKYAQGLKGKTFTDLRKEYLQSPKKVYSNPDFYDDDSYANDIKYQALEDGEKIYKTVNDKAKGKIGVVLEQYGFGLMPNSRQEADFPRAGVELKQTCIDIKKNGDYTAGERLSITNISYNEPVIEDFYESHVWEKTKLIMLIHYLRDKTKESSMDYVIKYANLFTPSENDLRIIKDDYEKINKKIKEGHADELSESDTNYLGACTKGSTAKDSYREQYYVKGRKAKKRNFCFKRSYMDFLLHNYIMKDELSFKLPGETSYRYNHTFSEDSKAELEYESIIKDANVLDHRTFEQFVIEQIENFSNLTDKQIAEYFNCEYKPTNKSFLSSLVYRILGIKSNRAEEFIKASIIVKVIRITEKGKIKEHMSLPPFKFAEFIHEEWETSTVRNYFYENRFLFVIFKEAGDFYKLANAKMWNMPYKDLEVIVKEEWLEIQNSVKNGVKFIEKNNRIMNSLPKEKDSKIIHVRPHAGTSAYELHNGLKKGNVDRNADTLPNGEKMTKQSFWLNNTYVLNQIKYK